MRKRIKVLSLILLILILLGFVILIIFFPRNNEGKISPDQQKVLDIIGYPQQFVITYVESGSDDKPQLIRNEIWAYPAQGTKVTFLGGKLAYSEDYTINDKVKSTPLHPEDFEFNQDYQDVAGLLGKKNVSEVTDIPGVTDTPGVKIYTSQNAMFVIENGYLTYIQTLDFNEGAGNISE